MIRSTYLHDFESDPILHRVHAVIPLGFLHSTFCATEKAIMENSKDNWARNCSLWSPAHLTSLIWQASPLSECSLSVITSSLYLFACSWGSLGQSPKVCLHLLLPPLQHLTPEKGSIQPDLFLIKSRHHFLLFSVSLQCSKITRGWLSSVQGSLSIHPLTTDAVCTLFLQTSFPPQVFSRAPLPIPQVPYSESDKAALT